MSTNELASLANSKLPLSLLVLLLIHILFMTLRHTFYHVRNGSDLSYHNCHASPIGRQALIRYNTKRFPHSDCVPYDESIKEGFCLSGEMVVK